MVIRMEYLAIYFHVWHILTKLRRSITPSRERVIMLAGLQFFADFQDVIFGQAGKKTGIKQSVNFATQTFGGQME